MIKGDTLYENLISYKELSRVYDSGDMYVALPNNEVRRRYRGINKLNLSGYTSKDVELVSEPEIEKIVMEYINSQFARS